MVSGSFGLNCIYVGFLLLLHTEQSAGKEKKEQKKCLRITWISANQPSWTVTSWMVRNVPSKEGPEAQQDGTELTAAPLAHTAEAVERTHKQKKEL